MTRHAGFSVVALLCACATPRAMAPEPSAESQATPREPVEVTLALESARSARTRALALTPPVYRGSGEPEDALQFVRGELAEWVKDRRTLEDAALAAYEKAAAGSAVVIAYANLEAGELHASFVDDLFQATLAAMPRTTRDDPAQAKSFESSLRESLEPQATRARTLLERCVTSAKRATLSTIAHRCAKRLALVARSPNREIAEPEEKLPDAPPRKWLDTREVRTCVFSGSLEAYVPLYSAKSGEETVAHLSGAVPLEVSELEPATSANERIRVDVSWPIRGSWWFAPNAEVLALGRVENIVAKHVWLEAGTEVVIARRQRTALEVSIDFTQGGRQLEPKDFRRTVPCKSLRLAGGQAPSEQKGDRVLLGEEGAPFFDSPKGKRLGRLAGGQFFPLTRLETRDDFSRVTGRNLFTFDGWVESSRINPSALGVIAMNTPKPHSHVVSAEIPLRNQPRSDAPVVATLAREAYVTRRGATDSFVELTVLGLGTTTAPARFFAETSAFDASTTAVED